MKLLKLALIPIALVSITIASSAISLSVADEDTGSESGIRTMSNLFKYIQEFRQQNKGEYPDSITDVIISAFKTKRTVQTIKSDLYDKNVKYKPEKMPEGTLSYNLFNTRPDGSSFSSPKSKGTSDVIALSDTYYFGYSNDPTAPRGRFLILRDNGKVELVPYDMIIFQKSGSHYIRCFPMQPGVDPLKATIYSETFINKDVSRADIGKPMLKGATQPSPDNGGPESLVEFSRLLSFPDHYGIEREKLWETFSLTQEEFSLAEVEAGAQKLGLSLQLRRLSMDELKQLNTPALFLTTDDKRVVTLSNLGEKEAIVIDRGLTRIVSRETLAQKYSGEALVSQRLETSSSVAVADPVRVLTLQNKNEEISQQMTITNRGTQSLTLQIEWPIPGVTKAELSADTVAPGQSATLSLSMQWREVLKGDTQNVFVFLRTNDPMRARLQLGFQLRAPQSKTP